ncbi:MAG TPA: AAA family ATPase [Candidatus Acidoferrales bacterium]|nr:AAA family ATPase [Candidatus Acidoferrales bacterium]
MPISVAPELTEPAFGSTLSSGDRNALALAFFLGSIDRDPALADKIVVVDDPVSSLDEQRSLTTVQELRSMGERVSQIIILSHDKNFLCRVWLGIDRTRCSPISIERDGNGSNIVAWDVDNDLTTVHDRNHALLRSYLEGVGDHNRKEVAITLRPVLEAFLRVAYPKQYPATPGAMSCFKRLCLQNRGTEAEILDAADTRELENLVEYANLFHHDTNRGWQEVVINDGELLVFVRRVLAFTTRAG